MTDERIDELVASLTRDEKLRLVTGGVDPAGRATGYVPGVERLGVPPLRLVDGSVGVHDGAATAFPATIALGATWDAGLAVRYGAAVAREARAKGHDVVLGPGLNVVRVPTGGRTFEYVSEDPRLTATIGSAYVRGVESEGVGATAKHFVANNQERDRDTVDVVVDERTLREVYLPGFRAAVEAGASAVMTAYNRVNGRWMSEHADLLDGVLRGDWGFDGVVMSDWWGTHDTVRAANGGLDLEMPGVSPLDLFGPTDPWLRTLRLYAPSRRLDLDLPLAWRLLGWLVSEDGQPVAYPTAYFGDRLGRAIDADAVASETFDCKIRHVLQWYDRLGRLDSGSGGTNPTGDVETAAVDGRYDVGSRSDAHHALARDVAVRGTVLLANDGTLPLSGDESLAVIGPNAEEARAGGGGSSAVTPTRTVGPLDALRERAPHVAFERGVQPIPERTLIEPPGTVTVRRLRARLTREPTSLDAAADAARQADVAVVLVQDAAIEGTDRGSLALPGNQDRLVRSVAAANPRTVVVSRTSGPVAMPWLDDVAAVLQTWYPGQADGAALADVCYGEDTGGRLPVTFGRRFADYPVGGDERRYPGVDGTVHYDEGVFVGYRGFNRDGTDPLFPFGHGLSYTDFDYSDATASCGGDADSSDGSTGDSTEAAIPLEVTIENVGDRVGRDVVQVYVAPPDGPVDRPPKLLGGFAPVHLDAGERRRVSVTVPQRAIERYDEDSGWTVDSGEYELLVGRSSRNVRERVIVDVK